MRFIPGEGRFPNSVGKTLFFDKKCDNQLSGNKRETLNIITRVYTIDGWCDVTLT